MELVTTAVVATLSKLISLGLSLHKAAKSDGFDDVDIKALKSLIDTGAGLAQIWRRSSDVQPGALHLALITRAFGTALARYWGSSEALDKKDIKDCVEQAALKICNPNARPPDEQALMQLQSLSGDPLANPYYKALWDAFSNPVKGPDGSAPASPLGESPREFERNFRRAYVEALATPAGQTVQRWLLGLAEEKREVMRHILAEDMASWGQRHVFGNVRHQQPGDVIPFMSLDAAYVEPRATYRIATRRASGMPAPRGPDAERSEEPEQQPRPILGLIRELIEKYRLVVVMADFGHGKSLTARHLARDVAGEWLDANHPAPENRFPIFIKCARDIRDHRYVHGEVVRRALWNAAGEAMDERLAMSDEAFTPVEADRAAFFVLDGLDEVSLSRNKLEDLFRTLDESLGTRQRAIVFTRPGALPDRACLPDGTPLIELLPFDDEQIVAWAGKWNRIETGSRLDVTQLVTEQPE